MTTQLYADDLHLGDQFNGSWHTVDKEIVDLFSRMTGDNHPIHYDEEYAKRTRFGQPVVHGLLVTSLTALGATHLSARMHESMVAFVGIKAEFLVPVFVGSKVQPRFTVLRVDAPPGKRTSRVDFRVEMLTEADTVCLRGEHSYILKRRPQPALEDGGGTTGP